MMAPPFVNHYAQLDVSITANESEFVAAYSALVQQLQATDPKAEESEDAVVTESTDGAIFSPASTALRALFSRTKNTICTNREPAAISTAISETQTAVDAAGNKDEEEEVRAMHWQPSSSTVVVEVHKLDDAYTILGNPMSKKVYDMLWEKQLCKYENGRIAVSNECVDERQKAVKRAREWCSSLRNGNEEQAAKFGRVAKLAERVTKAEAHFRLIASSRMAGPVVSQFVETMEL